MMENSPVVYTDKGICVYRCACVCNMCIDRHACGKVCMCVCTRRCVCQVCVHSYGYGCVFVCNVSLDRCEYGCV